LIIAQALKEGFGALRDTLLSKIPFCIYPWKSFLIRCTYARTSAAHEGTHELLHAKDVLEVKS
jgi:hypothetical protein